jgi:molybdate transport system substrate-binding protein
MRFAALLRTGLFFSLPAIFFAGECAQKKAEGGASQGAAGLSRCQRPFEGRAIELFLGAASKPAAEELIAAFEKKTGASLAAHFGGSGQMLSAMKLTGRGDVYFPGSSDFMERAKKEGLVDPATERPLAYLVPAINVQRGNPKRIKSLEDLARPGLRVGIARPDTVCVGLYATELLEATKTAEKIAPNIVTHAESCEKLAQLVALGALDAAIGWDVFEHWDEQRIETVFLPREQLPRIGYIPVAVSRYAKDFDLARAFVEYAASEEGNAIFRKWGYLVSAKEAREKYARFETPIGGEWALPERWKERSP